MKALLIIVLLALCASALAPECRTLLIEKGIAVNPYDRIMKAVGMVESSQNTLAYNPFEDAVGYFQIRPIRLEDYNKRTGNNYDIADMYDYRKAETVFLYYACAIGFRNPDEIILQWNCRSKEYLKRVNEQLK